MHHHLKLVRDFHDALGIPQAAFGQTIPLSDDEIILRQALLFACASETFNGLAADEPSKIQSGLVDLAFNALAAIANSGDNVITVSSKWRQDGSSLTVVRLLTEKIQQCASGDTLHYSALYQLCTQLVENLLQTDFDRALQKLQQQLIA
jgi:hypothetical protein